ncbi:putative cyclin-D6-1 [Nymphaea thermarum]|nr:putative cyclin-D6-1 [Nymphaea thermarum]
MEIVLDHAIVFFSEEQESETESIELLFSTECEHMPDGNYSQKYKTRELQASHRQEAISLILKISRLDHSVAYLAVNYYDRFISWQDIPVN